MHIEKNDLRILAIDLRSQRYGYGVLGSSKQLLDWGTNSCKPGGEEGAEVAAKRVAILIELFHPAAIVVRVSLRSASKATGVESILRSLQREARGRSIPWHLMNSDDVSKAFSLFRAGNKYEVASALTAIFPELLWKLPHKRRTWEPEPHVMAVFDAIAVGFAYLEANHQPHEPSSE